GSTGKVRARRQGLPGQWPHDPQRTKVAGESLHRLRHQLRQLWCFDAGRRRYLGLELPNAVRTAPVRGPGRLLEERSAHWMEYAEFRVVNEPLHDQRGEQ